MARPTPESLREAADKTEAAEVARQKALAAEEVAKNEKATADSADANAEAALVAAGVGSNDGNNGSGSGSNHGNLFAGGGLFAWFLPAVVLLILAVVIALAWFKADRSQVDAVGMVANKAHTQSVANDVAIGALKNATKKDIEQIASVANMANDKADKALNKPCSVCVKEEVILSRTKSKTLVKKPVPKKVHKPQPSKPVQISQQKSANPVKTEELTKVDTPVMPVAPVAPVAACCENVPHVEITAKVPRTDGRCVLALNDSGTTKYVRLDEEKVTRRLLAFRVNDSDGNIDRSLPITYVGYINATEKKTVEINGAPSCATAVKVFSEDKNFQWTAPRLHLGDKCKVVGKV